MNSTKEWFTGFTSNVAGVIIGIALTFGITSIIQQRQESRQTKLLLSMVRDELQMNIEELKLQKEYMISEYAGARGLMPYINAPETIPADTINKYIDFLVRYKAFNTLTASLEVLKNSSQIGTFSNKELILEVFNIYEVINSFYDEWYSSTTSRKEKNMIEYLDQMDSNVMDAIYTRGYAVLFANLMKKNAAIRNYIVLLDGGHNQHMVEGTDELTAQIEEVIAMLNEEIE